ncbi:MAG: tetratricopeptide repeat protein [Vicinamibacterales bacterium]
MKTLVAALVCGLVLAIAPAATAQSTMIKGRVVDGEGKPMPGVVITIEFQGGVARKFQTKTDRRGEFIQLLTESGPYKVTATADKVGSQSADVRVRMGSAAEANITLVPSTAATNAALAAELKKTFDEGVQASRSGSHDAAIEKFEAAAKMSGACFDCYYNVGVAYVAKKDEKQAEASWLKALELKADYAEALNALATLYNNQKRFDEATAMGAKAAQAGGGAGGSADAVFNQGVILWNQGKIAEAKVKFEESLKLNPNLPEAHYQLGMALLNEGKLTEAVASFETYVKLAPEGQYAAQAKGMIAQLKK